MTDMDFHDNAELLKTFVAEGQDMLDEVEPQLIEFQEKTEIESSIDEEALNSIFRMFHTIKGTAGFLELNNLQNVTHEAETILDLYRSGKIQPEPDQIRLLLQTCDFIRNILSNIEKYMHDRGFEMEAGKIVENLTTSITKKKDNEKTGNEPSQAPDSQSEDGNTEKEASHDDFPVDEEAMKLMITTEMVDQFVKESLDLLESLEEALLEVENAPENAENIDMAFRTLHTFKGNCGLLGYSDLEKLGHKTESLLEYMRSGEIKADKQTIRMILNFVDTFREGVTDISQGGTGDIQGCSLLEDFLDDEIKVSIIPADKTADSGDSEESGLDNENFEDVQDMPETHDDSKSNNLIPEEADQKCAEDSRPPSSSQTKKSSSQKGGSGSANQSVDRKDIRVDLDKVDKLVDLVGELALAEAMVIQNPDLQGINHRNFERAAHHLDKIISEIQYVSMSLRMIPIAGIFRKMIRLVHDLSYKAGKKVRLKTAGEETEIDKTVADHIGDPLVHIVRNSIDHGIEPPEERKKLGKNPTGTVFIEAKHEGGEVWIVIKDDGYGLNREKILQKAISQELISGDRSELQNDEIFNLIFEPGFSTAEQITEISGRGVGMDVVNKNMEKLNGNVDISSTRGQGTTIALRIPLTLATMEGMLVQVGSSRYTIPLMSIRECLKPDSKDITVTMEGQEIARIRDELLPVVRIHEIFGITPEQYELEQGHLVILQYHDQSYCIAVDRIIGQQQVVIKGLSDYVGTVQVVSGCTILGDGEISLIVDVGGLLDFASTGVLSNRIAL